ncbi:hypothetical protein DMI62_12850 [Escherichia coli]|nr:hypothetical protein [Escherichia coli]
MFYPLLDIFSTEQSLARKVESVTLIFTDETDESFTGVIQSSDGIYQLLLKISRRSTNRGTNPGQHQSCHRRRRQTANRQHAILRSGVCAAYLSGGDVPQERGVCSDVVIRALRSQKVDLQKLVHEDMAKNFAAYPQNGS